jgi:DNA-binding response OmpR family regulator
MRILLVEDSQRLSMSLSRGLGHEGYAVDSVFDGEEAEAALSVTDYELMILDLMLPRIDGLTVLSRLRQRGNQCLVLILTARDQVEDRVRGLEMGADDYLIKPFDFSELCARLQALTRRRLEVPSPCLCLGDGLVLDTVGRRLVGPDGEINMTATEYRLLEFLVLRNGRVFSKDKLIDCLYPANTYVTSNTVEVLVSSVRKKVPNPDLIRTRRGLGYSIDAESVTAVGSADGAEAMPIRMMD